MGGAQLLIGGEAPSILPSQKGMERKGKAEEGARRNGGVEARKRRGALILCRCAPARR